MSVEISLSMPVIAIFLLGMLFAVVGALDTLKITNISQKMKGKPEFLLLLAIGITSSPILAKLGNTISTNLGDILLLVSFFFFFFAAIRSLKS